MSLFEISVVSGGRGVIRLELDGEIDISVAPQLLDSVLSAAFAYEHHNIVLDMRDVTFMDPAGVNALVEADRRLRGENSNLVICNPSRAVRSLFEFTGLDDQFDIRPSWAASSLGPHAHN
jgi:anti-anti-sigma factor